MKGLRVSNKNTFNEIFSCIFDELNGLHWLMESDTFAYIETDSLDKISKLNTKDDNWYISKEDIFPSYSKLVDEDWNIIYGFKPESTDLKVWAKDYWVIKDRAEYISLFCDICFINIDASYWEIYSNNQNILNIIKGKNKVIEVDKLAQNNPGI